MGQRVEYINDVTGAFQEAHGSDQRLNVSSRVDSRMFYISRDAGQAYVLRIEDDDAAAADLIGYLRNDSTTKRLYVTDIHVSCENAACPIIFASAGRPNLTSATRALTGLPGRPRWGTW